MTPKVCPFRDVVNPDELGWSSREGIGATPKSLYEGAEHKALIVVEAPEEDELVHEAPAIVSRQTASALTHDTSA